MKCRILRKPFLEIYQLAETFTKPKSPKLAYQSVLLTVGDKLSVEASDAECWFQFRGDLDGTLLVDRPGKALLPEQFGRALKQSSDNEILLDLQDGNLKVETHTSKFSLPTEDPDKFPSSDYPKPTNSVTLPARDLLGLIKRTAFCVDQNVTEYAIGGCLFEIEKSRLNLVAMDGKRLAKATSECCIKGEDPTKQRPLVPAKSLRAIEKLLDHDGEVAIRFDDRAAWFETKLGTVIAMLAVGQFPRYQRVIPTTTPASYEFEPDELAAALQSASIVLAPESLGLDLVFGTDVLTISSHGGHHGSSEVTLSIGPDAQQSQITFDPRYCLDGLRKMKGPVTLEVRTSREFVVFRSEDYVFVLAPMAEPEI